MNYKRIGRLLVCLLLVTCLILDVSPVKAEATAAGLAGTITAVSTVNVPAGLAIGAAAIALGVAAGTNDDFQHFVNTSVSSGFEWIKDGTVELLRTVDELGNQAFYVAGEFLEDLRSLMFDSGALNNNSIPSPVSSALFSYNGNSYLYDIVSGSASVFVAVASISNDSRYRCGVFCSSASPFTVRTDINSGAVVNTGGASIPSGGSSYIYSGPAFYSDVEDVSSVIGLPVVYIGEIPKVTSFDMYVSLFDGGSITTSYDLSLGHISTVPIDGTSARSWAPDYASKGMYVIEGGNDPDPDSDPPNDGKWFLPLALPLTAATLFTMSQADEWSGETPLEFSEYSTSTEYEIADAPEIDGYPSIEIRPVTFPSPDPGTGTDPDPGTDPDVGGDTGDTPDYTSWFRRIIELLEEILERFKTWVADWKTAIEELPSKFAKWFDNICETLGNIWEWCQNLVSSLIDALNQLLVDLFAPSVDFIANKVNSLIGKYTYLEPMLTLGDHLKVYFAGLGTEPPIIYIDLGAATGSYYFGGRTVFVDLTWYEQYKPTMDAIIAGFLWLWVAWRLFQSVPGIIQGLSGIWGTPESVPDATFHNPKYQVGKNWLNSGSFYHRKGDRGE